MTWSLDPHHTSVAFSAKHLGVATVRGSFGQVTANLELDDPNDPTTGSGSVTIQAATATRTGNATVTNSIRTMAISGNQRCFGFFSLRGELVMRQSP